MDAVQDKKETPEKGKLERGNGMNQLPKTPHLLAFGLQHALIILFQTLPAPLLISAGVGLDAVQTALLVASALFVSGICTFIQSFGLGPISAGTWEHVSLPLSFAASYSCCFLVG